MGQATVLSAAGVSFGYEKGRDLFRDVSFAVRQGEVYCLFGPNGCGKTTLLDCVMGINKVSSGAIKLLDKDVTAYKREDFAKQVAYVPQVHSRAFPYTVKQVVMMGRNAYAGAFGSPQAEDEAIAMESIVQVGLEKFADTPYTRLSGGEVQLVMLARALGQRTKIIIMDEPTCHLDFANEVRFLETLVQLCGDAELSILMATHTPNHAYYFETHGLAVRVSLMYEQKLAQTGAPTEVLTEETIEKVYGIKAKIITYKDADGKEQRNIALLRTADKAG